MENSILNQWTNYLMSGNYRMKKFLGKAFFLSIPTTSKNTTEKELSLFRLTLDLVSDVTF